MPAARGRSRSSKCALLGAARGDELRWPILAKRLRLARLLEHPSILPFLELQLEEDPPFLAVESRAETSLAAALSEGSVTADEAQAWALSLAAGVAEAHRMGLAHGSLAAESVRITAAREAQLDFSGTLVGGPWKGQPHQEPYRLRGPAADIVRLADLLARLLLPHTQEEAALHAYLTAMRASDPTDRPSAAQVLAQLGGWQASVKSTRAAPADSVPASLMAATLAAPTVQVVEDTARQRLGRFHLLEQLGKGGMGAVHRAEDLSDRSIVAIKILRKDWSNNPDAVRRFHKEARLLAEVKNPYVANLLEVNEDDGIHFLVLEYVAGKSLDKVLRDKGHVDEATALAIMADVCRALVDAHERGIIHRDIKPDNILLVETRHDRSNLGRCEAGGFRPGPACGGDGVAQSDPGGSVARHAALHAAGTVYGRRGQSIRAPTSTPWARRCSTCWRAGRRSWATRR